MGWIHLISYPGCSFVVLVSLFGEAGINFLLGIESTRWSWVTELVCSSVWEYEIIS